MPRPVRPCPDWVICAYAATAILLQAFYHIDAVMTAMHAFPLRQLLAVFKLAGVFLLLWDTVSERVWMRFRETWPLVGTLAALFLSSCLWPEYRFENGKVLMAQGVQMLLIFPLTWRLSREECLRLLRTIYTGISAGYLPAILLSMGRFFLFGTGVSEGRLQGVFVHLYFPGVVAGVMAVASVYFAGAAERPWKRRLFAAAGVIYGAYNLLNGTRAVLVAYGMAALVWAVLRLSFPGDRESREKAGNLRLLPAVLFLGLAAVGGILQRTDVNLENITNNRIYIWMDYWEAVWREGKTALFGFSPGGYQPEIRARYPDIFIVSYIRDRYPQRFAQGYIYDVHNGYLGLIVSTGLLGTCSMGAFFFLWLRRLLIWLRGRRRLSREALALLAALTLILTAVFFDSDLFFRYNSTSLLFWLLAGSTFRLTEPEKGRL